MNPSDIAAPLARTESPISSLAHIITSASRFSGDQHGLDNGERAALQRLDPDPASELRPHQIAALSRALINAKLAPETWQPEMWHRWKLIAHGIALVGHKKGRLGRQLFDAGVSEPRVTKLLTARGDAFRQLLPRLLRLLASKSVAPNWDELGKLILNQECDEEKAETIRLKIAASYFSAANPTKSE